MSPVLFASVAVPQVIECKKVQCSKVDLPHPSLVTRLNGIYTLYKLPQSAKALSPRHIRPSGKARSSENPLSEVPSNCVHPAKAESPIENKLFGKLIVHRLMQFSKALLPMDVTF